MSQTTKILSYKEVLKQTHGTKRNLLLGNGFSMAYDNARFSYTSLLQSALEKKIIKRNSPLHKAFLNFGTYDFESIIRALENTDKIISAYGYESLEDIQKDSENLKNYLVDVVTNNHPDKCTDIKEEQYASAIDFIKDYDRIFTINYDLLLYWITMRYLELISNKKIKKELDVSDGFATGDPADDYVEFLSDPNILYLHGGLHIFDIGSAIIKNTYSRTDVPLKEQTLNNLKKNIYPVFISEGTSEQKLSKIMHNAYLSVCFRRLRNLSKNMSVILFGTKLVSGDAHIRDAIIGSNCKDIYFPVSYAKQITEAPAMEFSFKAGTAKTPKTVHYFDYTSVNIWNKYIKGK